MRNELSAPGSAGPQSRRVEGAFSGEAGTGVLVIAGTRPECIKLAPLVLELRRRNVPGVLVASSGQHAEAVRRSLAEFELRPDIELPPLPAFPNLVAGVRELTRRLQRAVADSRCATAIVQGDTLTAYAGARAARAAQVRVVHVEAGLRAPTQAEPFPEEWFRRRIARHADLHFAPCASALRNLVREGVPRERIDLVGNTGIDSLRSALPRGARPRTPSATPCVIVTLHRRENWDSKADIACDALLAVAAARPDATFLVPVHPNPRIAKRLTKRLAGRAGFELVGPLGYRDFVLAMAGASLIISDSGGLQEEAPYVGVPLLVPRTCTERPEALATGFVRIVPVDRDAIVREALALLRMPRRAPLPFDARAPFGDGRAATRIADALTETQAAALTA